MIVLGIETSCDETAAAVLKDGRTVLSSIISTQIPIHRPFSGVVPEVASRAHVHALNQVIDQALKKAELTIPELDAIGVTIGPGLAGSLLVGRMTAEALGWVHDVPVIGVNHIEGHLLSPLLLDKALKPPFLGLVVSGGHTELIVAKRWGDYQLVGRTRDDAAGEAFDKVAKMMGLGYPGGPVIDRLAREGDASKEPFPRPWLRNSWDFSFSGLKTAVLYRLREKKNLTETDKKNLCAGFQMAVIDVLVGKAIAAAQAFKMDRIIVGGGVAANSLLRSELGKAGKKNGISITIASPDLCTDNAAMIAMAASMLLQTKRKKAVGSLKIQPQMHIPFISGETPPFKAPANS